MRYILFDYEFAKNSEYYWEGLDLLSSQDILQIICMDINSDSMLNNILSCEKMSKEYFNCRAKIITANFWELAVKNIPVQEIIIISTQEKFLALQNNYKTKIYRYASVSKYFSDSFRRERNEILNNLILEDSQKEQVNFWVRRAFCIKDSGRRKYKTHNKLQAILKNSEQLKQIYQAVKPFL